MGYHTNYRDVTLWPLVPDNYYYMSPAWTRGAATDLATEQNAKRTFQISQQGFRVVREVAAAEEGRGAPEGDARNALRRMEEAFEVWRAGEPVAAMELMAEASRKYPQNALVWNGMAMIARHVLRVADAEAREAAAANLRRAADTLRAMSLSAIKDAPPTWAEASAAAEQLVTSTLYYHELGDTDAAAETLSDAREAVDLLRGLATGEAAQADIEYLSHGISRAESLLEEPVDETTR